MELNYWSILLATILQFIVGAIWYGPIFGNLWGRIHGFDKLSKIVQEEMMKKMGPVYGLQFLVTALATFILAILLTYQPTWNAYVLTGIFWLGFVVPTQISAVLFGGTEPKWIVKKILVQALGSLACLETGTIILKLMM